MLEVAKRKVDDVVWQEKIRRWEKPHINWVLPTRCMSPACDTALQARKWFSAFKVILERTTTLHWGLRIFPTMTAKLLLNLKNALNMYADDYAHTPHCTCQMKVSEDWRNWITLFWFTLTVLHFPGLHSVASAEWTCLITTFVPVLTVETLRPSVQCPQARLFGILQKLNAQSVERKLCPRSASLQWPLWQL